jgi:hypothetical protein
VLQVLHFGVALLVQRLGADDAQVARLNVWESKPPRGLQLAQRHAGFQVCPSHKATARHFRLMVETPQPQWHRSRTPEACYECMKADAKCSDHRSQCLPQRLR